MLLSNVPHEKRYFYRSHPTCPNHPRPQVHSVPEGVAADWVV